MRVNAISRTLYLDTLSENKKLKKYQTVHFRNTPFLTIRTTLAFFFSSHANILKTKKRQEPF